MEETEMTPEINPTETTENFQYKFEYMKEQNKQLIIKLNQMQAMLMSKRLDYLFKVLEYTSMFPQPFITDCAKEIRESLTITERDDETK